MATSSRLPFAFGWLLRDGEWAMGHARYAHSHDWGDLFWRNGGPGPDTIDRVMAAWLTWRQIPVPEWRRPVVARARQPAAPPPQPCTYGNADVPKVSQPRHSTDPAPASPADQASPTTARPLGETSTIDTPARPVRLSRPNRGRGAQVGPRGLWNHDEPTHRAPSRSVQPNEPHVATHQRHSITRAPPAHHHRAQPPGTGAIQHLPPRGRASGLKNPLTPRTKNHQPPQAPQDDEPYTTWYQPANGITP